MESIALEVGRIFQKRGTVLAKVQRYESAWTVSFINFYNKCTQNTHQVLSNVLESIQATPSIDNKL